MRATSGSAARNWIFGPLGFVFVDAVHDFANIYHDLNVWTVLLVPGGLVACHETDNQQFAGTQLAVRWASDRFRLHAHINDLVIFEKP